MAAVEIPRLFDITLPGFHQQPTLGDLSKSGEVYNGLPDDAEQPLVPEEIISGLRGLLQKYNVQDKFGFHLIHGHMRIAEGMVMFGKHMERIPGLWTRPMKIESLDLSALRGFVYTLGSNGNFHPYEYRQGAPPPVTANDNAFIHATREYLQVNGLAGLIGLELVSNDAIGQHMKEFVLSDTDGTVMLPDNAVNPTEIYRTTGWNGINDLKGNVSSHAKTTKGLHQVFTDGKALPKVEEGCDAEETVIEALRGAGIIN